jgi:hypothetical protein
MEMAGNQERNGPVAKRKSYFLLMFCLIREFKKGIGFFTFTAKWDEDEDKEGQCLNLFSSANVSFREWVSIRFIWAQFGGIKTPGSMQ